MSSSEIEEEHTHTAMKSADSYKILEELGQEKGAIVYKAKYIKPEPKMFSGEVMVIKVFERRRLLENVICLTREIEQARMSEHKNVTRVCCSFVHDGDLWVVMRRDHVASLARIVSNKKFCCGLPERVLGFLLKEGLEGLDYLHRREWRHLVLDLGHVFVDSDDAVRIDFGSLAYDPDGEFEDRPEAVAMPPEMLIEDGLQLKSDIWSFGIVALKLALGYIPARNYEELAAFLAGWPEMVESEAKAEKNERRKQGRLFRGFGCFSAGFPAEDDDTEAKKMISPAFMKMVAECLTPEPSKRPTTRQLMECDFFRELQGQKPPSFLASLLGN